MESNRELILGIHAMWARDYEKAVQFYTSYLAEIGSSDLLTSYRVNFDLAVANSALRRQEEARSCFGAVNETLRKIEGLRRDIKKRTEKSVWQLRSDIQRVRDFSRIEKMINEYLPNEEKAAAFLISPRYARSFLRSAVEKAELSEHLQVQTIGIFRYTVFPELYRAIVRAYSISELELESISYLAQFKIIVKNSNVFYIANQDMTINAAVRREGLLLAQRRIHDWEPSGKHEMESFLGELSSVFSDRLVFS